MASIITLPAIVADATEAIIHSWIVNIGEKVIAGQPIAEVETEKATVELEAERSGTMARLLVDEGASIPVGSPIAVLSSDEDSPEDIDRLITENSSSSTADAANPSEAPHEVGELQTAEVPAAPLAEAPSNVGIGQAPQPGPRRFSSPIARRIARENGINLQEIRGSGPGNRILRRDVEAATAARQERTVGQDSPPVSNYEELPLSGMRRAIARRLTESKTTVPHFYLSAEVDMGQAVRLRQELNAALEHSGADYKISVNDLCLKALGNALIDVPEANALWQDDHLRQYTTADISVAVATDGGLLTPVVRHVDARPLASVARTMIDFKTRAAIGQIKQPEIEGGSFSLTNLGMFGTREFSAIINPPQAGILALGVAEERPVVRNGQLDVATVMTATLSADHRVIDGAVAARLLAAFQRRLENPLINLL
ncbi:dihydrolipoamide acetyltransferase family protein [Micrococcus terreus]|uniref:dihydrolipoamide acetyltransferase family protein n=1 Tax=Micrococcus terreus TaxID=574650 RepID=UPI0025510CA8|nr:dihydrolipoamide acetyltransferase family protein [Micrococcus terreus]MDK7701100.1 dihydrolipoamide acetyltransferase family protein [Micrococcus terreus]WOO96858.1 dihydrolipoamide acetyltransferase family protein [Micrococcus terreus]